jgi:transcriptional regulator with XRE-family HTH domain
MMNHRLEKYIVRKHEELFEDAIIQYISKYGNDTYAIEEFYSNGLYLGDAPDLDFYGYIKMDCTICKNDEYSFKKTYQVTFKSNIACLDKIEIVNVDDDFNIPFDVRLNTDFSRYMEDNDYEKMAKDFLKMYYPEAFDGIAIDVNIVLERMGLNLVYKSLSETGNTFAMIAFEDMTIKTYKWRNLTNYTLEDYDVKANTIVMDDGTNELFQDSYRDNFTKIHECVHYFKDKKYYYFNKLFSNSSAGIFCNVNKYDNEKVKRIEIQANIITSRILMYKGTVERKINEYKNNHELVDAFDYKNLFDYLRGYFKCSIQALRIRLLALGYSEFTGIYEYVDNKYVEPYLSLESIAYDETYSIGLVNAALLELNPYFNELLSSGMYLYVDSHLCIKDPKYITNLDGVNHLSPFAWNNISKCCLKFKVTYKNNFNFSNMSFLRTANTVKPKYQFLVDGEYQDELSIEALKKQNISIKEELSGLPNNFGDALKKLMENRGITVEALASDSNVSEAQIKRLRNNEEQGTKPVTLVKICVGLQLPPLVSRTLLLKKSVTLTPNTDLNILLNFILDAMFREKVYKIEELIENYQMK